jgi:hypothetical protein
LGRTGTGTPAVRSAEQVEAEPKQAKKVSIPPRERLLMDVVEQSLIEAGWEFHIPDGPKVKAVADEAIRPRYFARIAEQPLPDEKPEGLNQRQRQAFSRALNSAIKAKRLIAADHSGQRIIWLP